MGAEFIIEFLDAIGANACKYIAKEKDSTQFELTKDQKERLVAVLAKVLAKYQIKMGPVATFFVGFLMFFGMNFKEAYSMRLEKQKEEAEKQEIETAKKKKIVKEKKRAQILSRLIDKELTLSELADEVDMEERAVRRVLNVLRQDEQIVVNTEETPQKYKAA